MTQTEIGGPTGKDRPKTDQRRRSSHPQPQPLDQPAGEHGADEAGEEEVGQRWAEFSAARASLAKVAFDDGLRSLGINLEAAAVELRQARQVPRDR